MRAGKELGPLVRLKMIYNLWSTPRTGSVWYSIKLLIDLRQSYPNTQLLSEIFNPYHLTIYKKKESDSVLNLQQYEHGSYYEDYQIVDGELKKVEVFGHRGRNASEEERYRLELVKQLMAMDIPLVIHNHVHPLNPEIYQFLHQKADRNIFIGRKDVLKQVASYAVAYASKVFAQFSEENLSEKMKNIQIDDKVIENLISRIKFWDALDKTNAEIVYYEDIDFNEHQPFQARLPRKQNLTSAMDKLSSDSQAKIRKMVDDYLKTNRL